LQPICSLEATRQQNSFSENAEGLPDFFCKREVPCVSPAAETHCFRREKRSLKALQSTAEIFAQNAEGQLKWFDDMLTSFLS
jgi:hypothetical protein